MGQLDGKVAIVTGGNRGIGKGIAKGLAAEGASLTIAARNAELLEETANELRANDTKVLAVPTDVTDEAQIKALFEKSMAGTWSLGHPREQCGCIRCRSHR